MHHPLLVVRVAGAAFASKEAVVHLVVQQGAVAPTAAAVICGMRIKRGWVGPAGGSGVGFCVAGVEGSREMLGRGDESGEAIRDGRDEGEGLLLVDGVDLGQAWARTLRAEAYAVLRDIQLTLGLTPEGADLRLQTIVGGPPQQQKLPARFLLVYLQMQQVGHSGRPVCVQWLPPEETVHDAALDVAPVGLVCGGEVGGGTDGAP